VRALDVHESTLQAMLQAARTESIQSPISSKNLMRIGISIPIYMERWTSKAKIHARRKRCCYNILRKPPPDDSMVLTPFLQLYLIDASKASLGCLALSQ
jgi:hypothetical protein